MSRPLVSLALILGTSALAAAAQPVRVPATLAPNPLVLDGLSNDVSVSTYEFGIRQDCEGYLPKTPSAVLDVAGASDQTSISIANEILRLSLW